VASNFDFLKDFVEEALIHVDSAEVGLLKLEKGEGDADIIHSIFRNLHSIKGTAGFFSLKNIVSLSHAMENLFGEIRTGNVVIDNNIIDVLLSSNDCLKKMIIDVENSEGEDISNYTAKIAAILNRKNSNLPADISSFQPPGCTSGVLLGNDIDTEAVREAARRGQKLYNIRIMPGDDPPQMLNKIKSIGRIAGGIGPEGLPVSGATFDVLVLSVLERNLLSIALDIDEESIIPINEKDLLTETTEKSPAVIEYEAPVIKESVVEAPSFINSNSEVDEGTKKRQGVMAEDSVRVHITLLNDLLNLASEMVLGRNQLLRILEDHRKEIPGLNAMLQNIDGVTTELQEKIMQTRMQPVAKVFNKFPRIVRELSRKMEKDLNLRMEGTSVELDKSIIEALGDPLAHLIRNAVDHGIETPDIREKECKPRSGTIILKAYHEGGHVHIDVIDDGVGINIEIIKDKAFQKKLISPGEIDQMGERELLNLLFCPGFSTAEKVTDLSGRGVGMDVVKTNIEKLGGSMEIMTKPGQGTTFRLILPLTLAIISSLIVETEGQKFAIPQVNLKGMVRVKPGDPTRKIEHLRGSEVLRLRGRLLPLVHLADVLGLKNGLLDKGNLIRILVVKSGSKQFGLVVDNIYDGEEILVKPIPKYLSDCHCYSGVTIMGDGRIAMILDPEGIANRAGLRFLDESGQPSQDQISQYDEHMSELQNLLLFKCSGPETFGIHLSMVARVEKIHASKIERVGKKEFIQFKGEALRVIRPENYLPVTSGKLKGQHKYVIIPKTKQPLGILIEKIHNTMETNVSFNKTDIKTKGLVGSAILDDRIVLFINIYELFEMASPKNLGKDQKSEKTVDKTLLLAEDTSFFAKVEKEYLESAGYKVITAVNGREAWNILQEREVDGVVSDIEMPLMDGYELVKRIRADKRLSSLPVVAVTSKADEWSLSKGIDAGFDFYEIKLDKERLLEKIRLAFQKRSDAV